MIAAFSSLKRDFYEIDFQWWGPWRHNTATNEGIQCRMRDGWRCCISERFDQHRADDKKEEVPRGPKASCEVAHIFPVSLGIKGSDGLVRTESFRPSD
jgi:hypothetical protein